MKAVGRLGSYFSTVSGPFHPFGGAVDIIVVEQPDGSFKSSPWYVRFGKFQGVLKTREKVVNISVDGVEAGFHMYLDHKGEAYFLREVDGEIGESVLYPSSSSDETDEQSGNRRPAKSNFDANQSNLVTQIDVSNGKVVARTNSRRSQFLGLVFGRRSMKEDEGGAGMVRASSLERAEIAADLLDVKWSTNLTTSKPRKDNASRFSAPDTFVNEADKVLQINDAEIQVSSLLHDDMGNRSDNGTESGFQKTGCSVEETSAQMSRLSTPEQAIETSTSGESGLEEKCKEIPEISTKIDEFSVGNADRDENGKVVISKIISPDSKISDPIELDACPSKLFDEGGVFDEKDVVLPGSGASQEESGMDRVQSFVCCETSESSRVGLDASGEQTHETLYFSCRGCEEVRVRAESLHETTELISVVNSQPESGVLLAEEPVNNVGFLGNRDRCKFFNEAKIPESEGTSMNSIRNSIVTESLSSIDIHLITSNSAETEMLEVTHQDTVTERLAWDINLETEVEEVPEIHSQRTNPFYSCKLDHNEVDLEEPSTILESYTQNVGAGPILVSVEEVESLSICTISGSSNSVRQVQDEENIKDENSTSELQPSLEPVGDPQEFNDDCVPAKAMSIPPSVSSGEEQFLFSDLDDLKPSEVQCMESISIDCVEKENHPSLTLECIEEVNESGNTNYKSYSSSGKFLHEDLLNDFENLKSRIISNPISIPRRRELAGEEVGRLAESLPNMWSHVDKLEPPHYLHHPLSHSLDSSSKSLNWALLREDVSSCIKLDADKEHRLPQEQPTVEDTRISGEVNIPANLAVEISLCKHLLYDGMGADAASQAFDAEKLDIHKFASLGPAVMKNDRLVVRIDGCYFPWDAAAPIVLGMVSFGREHIFEPKGMIAIDQVERTLEGDPSKAIVASSGSWRLWPFSFQRSRSKKAIQAAPEGTRSSDVKNASENTVGMDGDKIFLKPKVTKNKVDARIYLWKWNTRIVISDVDGTITRSDVLGQFMPLVGIDWFQTGVAHLFSAIKENGYQLIFLSARAISQAYHTRQFLLNLKQDGKALPDGPVVISPDGLFPSLFREVIRRAPHEFKIGCLEDIRALFPSDCNPFYAGFGNRDTDEISYLRVGIPKGKIFIINPKGEVAVNRRVDTKSYTSLHTLVNGMFPPKSSSEQEDFNSWNYWKLPPPVIDI